MKRFIPPGLKKRLSKLINFLARSQKDFMGSVFGNFQKTYDSYKNFVDASQAKMGHSLTNINVMFFQSVETCTRSDIWSSSWLSIQYVRLIRALLVFRIKRIGIEPEKDEYLLRLAFVLSSPHIVDYFYYRSDSRKIASVFRHVPQKRVLANIFVLQCLTQPSFKIDYRDVETLLNDKNLWPLIISKGVEYRFFFNHLSDLQMQFDFLQKNIETFTVCLKSGKFTDLQQFLRWYMGAPPIGFSASTKKTYELYRALEQVTLLHLGENLPDFQTSKNNQKGEKLARIGFVFLSLLSRVESKLVLETLEWVPENYQIVMIGLNDKEYSPELENLLRKRKIKVALVNQLNVTDALSDLRQLNLDVLFYCSPFWGHFLSRIVQICAARVAPVQIAYIGEIITTGLSSCDYFMMSSILDNDQMKQRFTEKIMVVPDALVQFLCKPSITQVSSRKDNDRVVYFSNAHMWKLNGDLLDVWVEIISRVDKAIIRLAPLKSSFHRSYLPVLQDLIVKKCRKWGVSAKRFEIIQGAGPNLIQKQLAIADVYLDSFPYTASTSLLEALVEALPIVSLAGDSLPESFSKVILTQFHLEEDTLVLSKDAYIEKAVAFGQNAKLRKEISLKITKAIADINQRLDKRKVLLSFWDEVDKLVSYNM
jgi:predicted O-linked N-acetylglucosamine transferase (SPINDLY family)